jgi:uncharacterized membrane protein YtjA (UPF0391 family)
MHRADRVRLLLFQVKPPHLLPNSVNPPRHSACSTSLSQFKRKVNMLGWAVTFLIIALIAGVLGFTGIAGTAVGIAKILFAVFLVLFLISLIVGRRRTI